MAECEHFIKYYFIFLCLSSSGMTGSFRRHWYSPILWWGWEKLWRFPKEHQTILFHQHNVCDLQIRLLQWGKIYRLPSLLHCRRWITLLLHLGLCSCTMQPRLRSIYSAAQCGSSKDVVMFPGNVRVAALRHVPRFKPELGLLSAWSQACSLCVWLGFILPSENTGYTWNYT